MEYKDIVLPNYDHCILGTISSILKYYNVETKHKTSEKFSDNRFCPGYIFQQSAAIHLRLYTQLQCYFRAWHHFGGLFTCTSPVAENVG